MCENTSLGLGRGGRTFLVSGCAQKCGESSRANRSANGQVVKELGANEDNMCGLG